MWQAISHTNWSNSSKLNIGMLLRRMLNYTELGNTYTMFNIVFDQFYSIFHSFSICDNFRCDTCTNERITIRHSICLSQSGTILNMAAGSRVFIIHSSSKKLFIRAIDALYMIIKSNRCVDCGITIYSECEMTGCIRTQQLAANMWCSILVACWTC